MMCDQTSNAEETKPNQNAQKQIAECMDRI